VANAIYDSHGSDIKGLENLVKNWKLGELYKTTNMEADIKRSLALLGHVNWAHNFLK
jgi:hypothetical protein